MRKFRTLVYFLQMLFVSYTILVVVYSSVKLLADAVGGATYEDMLVLFLMTACIALLNVLVETGRRKHLIRYLGDLAIVLGIGYIANGFVPFTITGTLIAWAILTAVYLGTWLFFYWSALADAGKINRMLADRRTRRNKP